MSNFSNISKLVGWNKELITLYPTMNEVISAIDNNDLYSLLKWNRYLISPVNKYKVNIINKIVEGLNKLK